jgi:tetratricopeptide (TPR) repeat protein
MTIISIPVIAASPWNSLEVTKLVIGAATPVLVAIVGYFVTRRLKTLESYQWGQQKLVEKRVEIFDKISPLLNRLLCYFTFVGTWKEFTPPTIVKTKRDLDELIYSNAPLFGPQLVPRYEQFMDLCFHTYSGWTNEPKLITAKYWRKKAAGSSWQENWDSFFEDPVDAEQAASAVRAGYAQFTAYIAEHLGVGLVNSQISPGEVPLGIGRGHPDRVNMELPLEDRGDVEGARTTVQPVIDSGYPNPPPEAALNLGLLLKDQGDVEGARAAFQQAIDSGNPDAALNLGLLLKDQGDVEGARAAFQQVIDSGHPDLLPEAALNLGLVLEDLGNVEGARTAFQQAIDSGPPNTNAMVNLGNLLKNMGDASGARAAYQQAMGSGNPEAALNLGLLLKDQGDVEGARAAFQQAIDSGNPDAALNLGLLLKDQGDVEGARAAFQQAQAMYSGDPDAAARARRALRDLG